LVNNHSRTSEEQFRKARELLNAGFLQEAETAALGVLREVQECQDGYQLLAEIEERRGKPQLAVMALQRATALDPDNATVWCRLGGILALQARWPEAIEAYTRAARLAPDAPIPLAALAGAQLAAQRIATAVSTGRVLIERFPHSADAHLVHGHICKVLGQFEGAARAYERALQLVPHCSSAAYSLTDLQLPAPGDPRTRDIESRVHCDDLRDSDRANFEFALARIYEGARQYDRAFGHYRNAKEATRRSMESRGLSYDPESSVRYGESMMQRYGADSFRSTIEPLPICLKPIFIVGMPRSGTTLVEQILATHPLVSSGGELTAAPRYHGLYLERLRQLGSDGPATISPRAQTALLMEMRERYVEDLFECGLDNEFVIDKLPGNFQHLGFIRLMFPDALIVHCQRAPISTCWSLYTSNFAADTPYGTSLANLAHYYRLYQLLMNHWRTVLQPPMIEVQYENLVAHPANVVRALLLACGLPWDEQCLEFHKNGLPVTTASVVQTRQPMFSTSLQRWKPFEAYLGELRVLQ
jgi:tetratricopeptide (TPR) repeat protein